MTSPAAARGRAECPSGRAADHSQDRPATPVRPLSQPGPHRVPAPRRTPGPIVAEAPEAGGARPRIRPDRRPERNAVHGTPPRASGCPGPRCGCRAGCTGQGRTGRPAHLPSRRIRRWHDRPIPAMWRFARQARRPRVTGPPRCRTPRETPTMRPAAGSRCRCPGPGSVAAADGAEKAAMAASISVSDSGRGIRVAGDTANSRPQNSRRPRISASGSRASRRASSGAKLIMSAGALGSRNSVSCVTPCAWASNSRASSLGLSMPACRSLSAARSIACWTVWLRRPGWPSASPVRGADGA